MRGSSGILDFGGFVEEMGSVEEDRKVSSCSSLDDSSVIGVVGEVLFVLRLVEEERCCRFGGLVRWCCSSEWVLRLRFLPRFDLVFGVDFVVE